jgi:hypothetical protein
VYATTVAISFRHWIRIQGGAESITRAERVLKIVVSQK